MGPAPRSAGTNPAEHHPRGRILVEAGGVPHRPLAAEPDRDGPRQGHRGGGLGWAPGLRGPGPSSAWAGAGETGRALGLRPGGGGAGGLCWLGAESREAPGGWARAPEGGRSLRGGGGGAPCPGDDGGPSCARGGGGRVSPGVGPCRFMAARHGTISPTLRAGVPFSGGLRGGGGAGGCRVHPPMRGGVAGGSSVRLGR